MESCTEPWSRPPTAKATQTYAVRDISTPCDQCHSQIAQRPSLTPLPTSNTVGRHVMIDGAIIWCKHCPSHRAASPDHELTPAAARGRNGCVIDPNCLPYLPPPCSTPASPACGSSSRRSRHAGLSSSAPSLDLTRLLLSPASRGLRLTPFDSTPLPSCPLTGRGHEERSHSSMSSHLDLVAWQVPSGWTVAKFFLHMVAGTVRAETLPLCANRNAAQ